MSLERDVRLVGDMMLTKAPNSNAVQGLIHKYIPLMSTILAKVYILKFNMVWARVALPNSL